MQFQVILPNLLCPLDKLLTSGSPRRTDSLTFNIIFFIDHAQGREQRPRFLSCRSISGFFILSTRGLKTTIYQSGKLLSEKKYIYFVHNNSFLKNPGDLPIFLLHLLTSHNLCIQQSPQVDVRPIDLYVQNLTSLFFLGYKYTAYPGSIF